MCTDFDLPSVDHLLSTTRAVRRRLDLERPVPREIIIECLRLSQQAPTGSNAQGWRWLVVTDADKRSRLADLYRRGADAYLKDGLRNVKQQDHQTRRVVDSALYLAEHLHRVPVHVIPCLLGRLPAEAPQGMRSGFYGSIYPAVWSFQLALRSRGLGSVITTLHLACEEEAAQLLEVPDTVTQVCLLPVAYTRGTDFKPAERRPIEEIAYWDVWKRTTS